jgi:hypothetical protein
MTAQLRAVTFDALDPRALAGFWAGLLGRGVVDEDGGFTLESGELGQPRLRIVSTTERKTGQNRQHFHLTSTSWEDLRATVDRVLALGGSHVDVGQLPEEDHVVLGDLEGNELCVIPPGNSFLAGTGQLGELSCDGTRAVGQFWAEALGWPLVWDQDEETAIQSPEGGTKISWGGGPPLMPRVGKDRLSFELAVDGDRHAEVGRLVSLGATLVDSGPDLVLMADPDGNEFRVPGSV